jgi:hypothetical protein
MRIDETAATMHIPASQREGYRAAAADGINFVRLKATPVSRVAWEPRIVP